MTLQQLKYVIAIAEKGSINEAAKVLYISQPSLTNAMHDLENDLGIQLFIRNNKGIRQIKEKNFSGMQGRSLSR